MNRNTLVTGTLWLTAAGLISRILGFVYRIYLSGLIGSEGMGLYQLISPVYFLLFTICSAGCHTAISQLVAAENARRHPQAMKRILWVCLIPASLLGLVFSFAVRYWAPWIAASILQDARAEQGIRILCTGLPFCIASTCLKAYFQGIQRMDVPASEQVVEQIFRMLVIYLLSPLLSRSNVADTCAYVVIGTVAGDLISCLYTVFLYSRHRRKQPIFAEPPTVASLLRPLLMIILPVTGSRALTQLLSSLENILLPAALQQSGLSSSDALSLYGELSGMVMPLISFPTILTGAMSSNLLPLVAGAKASGRFQTIQTAVHRSLQLTLWISFLCMAVFGSLGVPIGQFLYPGTDSGSLLQTLSLLCPFLYLQTTLNGLLNGSGLQSSMFWYQLLCSLLRIAVLRFLVPLYGFPAFLFGFLISSMISAVLCLHKILRTYHMRFLPVQSFLLPLLAGSLTYLILRLGDLLSGSRTGQSLSFLILLCAAGCLCYLLLLMLTGCLKKKDLREVLKLVKHNR